MMRITVLLDILAIVSLTGSVTVTPTITETDIAVTELVSVSISTTAEVEAPTVISGYTLIGIDQRHDKSAQCVAEEERLNLTDVQQKTSNCWEDDCICRGGTWIPHLAICSHLCDGSITCPERVCRSNPTCNPATGTCDYTQEPDGTPCGDDMDRRCYFGKCVASKTCVTSGNVTEEFRCPFPTTECVEATCVKSPEKICLEVPSTGTPCELGICDNGVCKPVVEENKVDLCQGVVCPPSLSTCRNLTCVDGRCVYENEPDGTPCTDFNTKTVNDTCELGVCVGIAHCVEPRTALVRSCRSTSPECTTVTCQADGLCLQINKPDGTLCSDGNPLTSFDSCLAGICVGTAPAYSCENHPHCFRPLLRCLSRVFPSCLSNYISQCHTVALVQHCQSEVVPFFCSHGSRLLPSSPIVLFLLSLMTMMVMLL